MDPRFVTKTMHAYLDYPVALSLMAAPFLLNLGNSHPMARWLAVGAGVAALVLTLLTDHKLGVFRVLPYGAHLAVDFLVGVVFLAAPIALGFTGLDAWYYWANSAAVLLVVGLHRPEVEVEHPETACTGQSPATNSV
jgi:hypothetical protein